MSIALNPQTLFTGDDKTLGITVGESLGTAVASEVTVRVRQPDGTMIDLADTPTIVQGDIGQIVVDIVETEIPDPGMYMVWVIVNESGGLDRVFGPTHFFAKSPPAAP